MEHTKDNVDSNLTLSWSYYQGSGDIFQTSGNVEPDYRFAENNKHFTQLANIIHEQELTEEMENRVSRHRMKKQEEYQSVEVNCNSNNDDCKSDEWIFENSSTSREAVYRDSITPETLKKAIYIYFKVFFCPDYSRLLTQEQEPIWIIFNIVNIVI